MKVAACYLAEEAKLQSSSRRSVQRYIEPALRSSGAAGVGHDSAELRVVC